MVLPQNPASGNQWSGFEQQTKAKVFSRAWIFIVYRTSTSSRDGKEWKDTWDICQAWRDRKSTINASCHQARKGVSMRLGHFQYVNRTWRARPSCSCRRSSGPGSLVVKLPKLNFDLVNLPNFWGLCWTSEKNWNWTWTLIWFPISQYVKMHKKFN